MFITLQTYNTQVLALERWLTRNFWWGVRSVGKDDNQDQTCMCNVTCYTECAQYSGLMLVINISTEAEFRSL